MDHYRPFSLLSKFSKIQKFLFSNRLIVFLENNNLIPNSQYGFRKMHSTLHPLVHFIHFISNAQNNEENAMVFSAT
jgi:hypothetical protein